MQSSHSTSDLTLLGGAGAFACCSLAGAALDYGTAWVWGFAMPAFALVFLAALPGCSCRRALGRDSRETTVQVALLLSGTLVGSAGYLLGASLVGEAGSVVFAVGVLVGAVSA
ncbi:hypothetical protein [Halomarina litorea]|uniref:hypothetical protein n=1 Tax=Halomarina litorea TaxID=2961595 RepID=UPI0020C42AF5|nr:hypothetical protein [Halomarina sp. BCD28]